MVRFERDEAHRLKPLGGRPAFGALARADAHRRQRLRGRGRHQQLLRAVAADRRARGRDGRLPARCASGMAVARSRCTRQVRRPAAARSWIRAHLDGRRRPRPDRGCRWETQRHRSASLAAAVAAAAAGRIRSRDRGRLLMPRAKKTDPTLPTDRLDDMLARLKLSGIRDQLDSLLDEAARVEPVGARDADAAVRARDRPEGPSPHRHGAEAGALPGGEGAGAASTSRRSPRSIPSRSATWRRRAGSPTARTCCCSARRASARRTWPSRSAGRRSWPATRCSSRRRWRWSRGSPRRTPRGGSTRSCSAWPRRSC